MLRLRPRRRRTLQSRERQASRRRHIGRHPRRRPGLRRLAWHRRAQRRRRHLRDAHAPRSVSYGRLKRRRGDDRAGGTSGPRRLSRALGRALRAGEFEGRELRARPRLRMWRVMPLRWKRLRWKTMREWVCLLLGKRGPSGGSHLPSRQRRGLGARGAMLGLFVGKDISSWQEKKRKDTQQTSFLCPRRTTHSFMERISKTRTVWSRDALASKFP
jgi:hypothetical protein